LLAHGQWFSPASSTTKTGRHDIAEILLKVALKHQKSNQNQNLHLVGPMLPVSLDCPFWIAPSVFSNVYLEVFETCLTLCFIFLLQFTILLTPTFFSFTSFI
jgi:hypothetical protein